MINFRIGQFQTETSISNGQLWLLLMGVILISLGFYALRSIGLYVLAKRQKIGKEYIAFIPYAWIYIACKLIKNTSFLGKSYEKWALTFAIIYCIYGTLLLSSQILDNLPLFEYLFISKQTLYVVSDQALAPVGYVPYLENLDIYHINTFVPYGSSEAAFTVQKILTTISLVSEIFYILSTIILIFVYISLFRTYWPQHYTLASVLCIFFGLFPFFMFAIRNKEPIDYNEYLKARYQRYGNPYGSPYGNPYDNPYNQGGQNGYGGHVDPQKPKNPFEDFASEDEKEPKSPFSEFDNDDKFDNDKN